MAHRKLRNAGSKAPQMIGGRVRTAHVEVPDTGDWYLVAKQIEHNGVAYLPLNHHLVEGGMVPERVPSSGAKGSQVGQADVPVDVTGRINLAGAKDHEVWALYKCGAIMPVDPAKSQARIVNGRRMAKTVVPAMIPPMRRIANLQQQYQQATSVPLTVEGMQNLRVAQATMPNPFGR